MNRRELIIIIITIAVAGFGLYDFFTRGQQDNSSGHGTVMDISQLAALTIKVTTDNDEDQKATQVFDKMQTPWRNGSIWQGEFNQTGNGSQTAAQPDEISPAPSPARFVYSGFMQMNNDSIAIINGIDYKQGETIDTYRLQEITPEHILLEQDGKTFIIPVSEGNSDSISQ